MFPTADAAPVIHSTVHTPVHNTPEPLARALVHGSVAEFRAATDAVLGLITR